MVPDSTDAVKSGAYDRRSGNRDLSIMNPFAISIVASLVVNAASSRRPRPSGRTWSPIFPTSLSFALVSAGFSSVPRLSSRGPVPAALTVLWAFARARTSSADQRDESGPPL
jgi:hypothetical protein